MESLGGHFLAPAHNYHPSIGRNYQIRPGIAARENVQITRHPVRVALAPCISHVLAAGGFAVSSREFAFPRSISLGKNYANAYPSRVPAHTAR